MRKFIVISKYGEILDIALNLKEEKEDVCFDIQKENYKKVGDGLVEKEDWFKYLGQGATWIIDGCESSNGEFADWLREKGESVYGANELGDKLEDNRQAGNKLFIKMGFTQPKSENFKDIDKMLEFVIKNSDTRWILKQNGRAPKSVNHPSHFEHNEDLIDHINELKQKWNENNYGEFDCDLMEMVKGLEVACSVFFNGKDFARNKEGKIVGFLNFEEKKECDGGLGETTGETGTTFYGCSEGNKIFDKIIKPKILGNFLRSINFIGCFDINGCIREDGTYTGFEPTPRFGIPTQSYIFSEGIKNIGDFFYNQSRGINKPVQIKEGWGMCIAVLTKPSPIGDDIDFIDEAATSINEKLYPKNGDKPIKDFTEDQRKHLHLCNLYKKDGEYRVATKCGWILVATITGKSIKYCRENLLEYIKENVYLRGMKYRQDIGCRIEDKMKNL